MMGNGWSMGVGGIFMFAFWLLFAGLLVWAVVALFKGLSGNGSSSPSARELLDRRLASGEIDSEEYQRLRQQLADSASPAQPGKRK